MENIEKLDVKTLDIDKKGSLINNVKKYAIEMCVYFTISICIILFLRTYFIQHVRVSGSSMEPTLIDKQHLLIEKVSYKIKGIKRFDVIVFQPYIDNKDLFYIKRVVGLPGETVKIENNTIFINGKILKDPYALNNYTDAKLAKDTILLGANDYFVLGDNREVSKDSREKEIGLLTYDSIVGKALMKIYPFNTVGVIE